MRLFQSLVQKVHQSSRQFVLVVTGGGSRAISEWLRVPGASRTLLDAHVPYSYPALAAWLGAPPENACSETTARAIAMAAFQHALKLAPPETNTPSAFHHAGLACSASLASDPPKRGPHRLHVALQTANATLSWSLEFAKGTRDRAAEEDLAAHFILNCALENDSAQPDSPSSQFTETIDLQANETIARHATFAAPAWRELMLGQRRQACVSPAIPAAKKLPRVIFPGAFHPRHIGHATMARLASEILSQPVAYEISLENVDKLPLDYTEINQRLAQFSPTEIVWLTRAPTFVEKAILFPAATFVVGADTLERIGSPKYYAHNTAQRDQAIAEIAQRGCKFLVFGRFAQEQFRSLDSLDLPSSLRSLCTEVGEAAYRIDISSTELRQKKSPHPI